MKTIKQYLGLISNVESIQDVDGLMNEKVFMSGFAINTDGSLHSSTKNGRIIIIFSLSNGSKVGLVDDKTDIKTWRKNGKEGLKPKRKLVLKIIG